MGKNSGSQKIDVVQYFMSLWYGFAIGPVDKILEIRMDDKVAWSGSESASTTINIDRQDLFGGIRKEGGVSGRAIYLDGRDTQVIPSDIAGKFGLTSADFPAHRGLASIFFTGFGSAGFYFRANQPNVPPIEIKAQRKPVGLNDTYAMIGNDANVVHHIYEVMTNNLWSIGIPSTSINVPTFESAAQTVHGEGIGISLLWSEQQDAEGYIAELLEYIEAVIFVNPRNGLLEIKLIRGDYDPDDLFEVNPSNSKLSGYQRKALGDTINEIVVSWTNPENEEAETVSIQDLANIAMQGRIVSSKKELPGVRSADLAMQLAARDLRVASSPLATCRATVNRTAWSVVPGDVVKLSWPEHGIESMIMRITEVDYGKTSDSSIKLTLIEDVFGLDAGEFYTSPSTGWEDNSAEPAPIDFAQVFTLPYYLTIQLGADATALQDDDVYVAVLGADANPATSQYTIVYETATPTAQTVWSGTETRSLISRTTLGAALPFAVTSAAVSINALTKGYGVDVDFIAVIGTDDDEQELCIVSAVGTNTVSLIRGCLDTVPRDWPVDTPIWFVPLESDIVDDNIRVAGQSITYRLLTSTSLGTLSVDDAPDVEGVLTERPWLPNRPANCKVNGNITGPVSALGASTVALTWSNRNRTLEDSVVLQWTDGDVTPESGQTTTITVLTADGAAVLTTINGLIGTSYTLNTSTFGGYSSALVKFTSKNASGQESLQGHSILVNIALGYGNDYGNNYGGA